MGDAAGIGPEIIMQALVTPGIAKLCRPIVIGDRQRLMTAARIVNISNDIISINDPRECDSQDNSGAIYCIDLAMIPVDLPFGKSSPIAGACAFQAIERAVIEVQAGKMHAICTAPISKAALHQAGHDYPGHTELLAALSNTPEVSLMMVSGTLRVVHVTMHMGLLDAIARIEPELVFRTIARGHKAMHDAGIAQPRIAVCGINPHAGEDGMFGQGEEAAKILPAIKRAQMQGWDVSGPHPADSLFFRARRGDFDLVVAMYHDQGLGPIKVLGIDEAVNITVGLPFIRTSVGHGVAFDIAGKGVADARGMMSALRQAAFFAQKSAR